TTRRGFLSRILWERGWRCRKSPRLHGATMELGRWPALQMVASPGLRRRRARGRARERGTARLELRTSTTCRWTLARLAVSLCVMASAQSAATAPGEWRPSNEVVAFATDQTDALIEHQSSSGTLTRAREGRRESSSATARPADGRWRGWPLLCALWPRLSRQRPRRWRAPELWGRCRCHPDQTDALIVGLGSDVTKAERLWALRKAKDL